MCFSTTFFIPRGQLWEFETTVPFLMAEIWPTSSEFVLTLLKYQADRIHGTIVYLSTYTLGVSPHPRCQ